MLKRSDSFVSGLVSVVIPTFNRSELVAKAIDSVLLQTYPFFEIIVVDDCSTDETILMLNKYGDKIRVFKNDVNSYVGFARNFGVSVANGEYIAFLDSDDRWLPNKLELQIGWMKINEFEICATSFYTYQKSIDDLVRKDRPYKPELRLIDILYGVYIAPGSTLIVRRDFFLSIGGYDITYRRLEDWDLLIRIFLKYGRIGFLNEPISQIFASNEYTINNLKKSSKKLFFLNYKSLWKRKWYYPIILLVGVFFELFIVNLRLKKYFNAAIYFIILNILSLFRHPYFKIHLYKIKGFTHMRHII
jgi:glycosyltransferase involved in cell wall biosynthesis